MNTLSELQKHLALQGLFIRGCFSPDTVDHLEPLPNATASTLAMIGSLGSSLWPAFSSSREYLDKKPNPMDRWSQRLGDKLAERYSGQAYYPFAGPPFLPFISWAQKAENIQASPLGLNLHPDVGLWHAYRFALLLPIESPKNLTPPRPHDCDQCTDKPCLSACPVEAFSEHSYKTQVCREHLTSHNNSECMQSGCLARQACPTGKKHQYNLEQAQFHMRAFAH